MSTEKHPEQCVLESLGKLNTTYTMPQRPTNQHKPYAWETGPMALLSNSSLQADDATPGPEAASKTFAACNCLIRALNSIYIQAPHVPMVEYLNFVSYCLATYQCLLTKLGSTFEKEGENKTLAEWGNWIESCSARRNNFSTDMCKSMMDEFMPTLHNQLSTHHNGESGKMSLDSNTQLPIFWTNHDITLEHELPRGLAPESKALRWWTARKKAEWWKFSTCGIHGLPRELKFYREM